MTTVAELIAFLAQFPEDTTIEVSMGHYFEELTLPVMEPLREEYGWCEGPFQPTMRTGLGFEYDAPERARDAVPPFAGSATCRAHGGFPARPRHHGVIRFGAEY